VSAAGERGKAQPHARRIRITDTHRNSNRVTRPRGAQRRPLGWLARAGKAWIGLHGRKKHSEAARNSARKGSRCGVEASVDGSPGSRHRGERPGGQHEAPRRVSLRFVSLASRARSRSATPLRGPGWHNNLSGLHASANLVEFAPDLEPPFSEYRRNVPSLSDHCHDHGAIRIDGFVDEVMLTNGVQEQSGACSQFVATAR